jgi:hypothetical protein
MGCCACDVMMFLTKNKYGLQYSYKQRLHKATNWFSCTMLLPATLDGLSVKRLIHQIGACEESLVPNIGLTANLSDLSLERFVI